MTTNKWQGEDQFEPYKVVVPKHGVGLCRSGKKLENAP